MDVRNVTKFLPMSAWVVCAEVKHEAEHTRLIPGRRRRGSREDSAGENNNSL